MKRKHCLCCMLIWLIAILLSGCAAPSAITVSGAGEEVLLQDAAEGRLQEESGPGLSLDLAAASRTEETIAVYVCGAVQSPRVVELAPGSRVCDALEGAGGILPDADTEFLNQARVLSDGEMLRVYTREETAQQGALSDGQALLSGAAKSEDDRINLNTATKEQLMTLPGVGEAKAEAILRDREENGPFASCEDIMRISGIKTSIFEKIRDRITV